MEDVTIEIADDGPLPVEDIRVKVKDVRLVAVSVIGDIGFFFDNISAYYRKLSKLLLGGDVGNQALTLIKATLYDVESSLVELKVCMGNNFCNNWLNDEDNESSGDDEDITGDNVAKRVLPYPMVLPCEDGTVDNWRLQKDMSGSAQVSYKVSLHCEDNCYKMFNVLCTMGRYCHQVRCVMKAIFDGVTRNLLQEALLLFNSLMCDTLHTSGKTMQLLSRIMSDE